MTDQEILQGRIYPAIQSCINNRYKIILGLFVYYGYVLSHREVLCTLREHGGNFICSLILTGFVIHNLVNYWGNRDDQMKREPKHGVKKYWEWPWIEITFSIIAFALIWGIYFFFVLKLGIW
jgi:hypothetical protein